VISARVPRILALLVAWLAGTAAAQAPEYDLAARAIAPGIWVVEGSTENFSRGNGGNIVNTAFMTTGAGVVVIDTGPSRRYGEALRALIEETTTEAISHVLITHHHPDHAFGSQAFEPATLYMLDDARAALARDGEAFADNMYRMIGDWMRGTEVVVPDNVLAPGVLEVGRRRLQIIAMTGHTGADLVVFEPLSGVLFASDMVFHNRALTTPQSPGLLGWRAELEQLAELPVTVLVPGHGPVSTDLSPLRQMADYLTWLDTLLADSARAGLSPAEVMNAPIPARFDGISERRYELVRTTTHLYPDYEKRALSLLPE